MATNKIFLTPPVAALPLPPLTADQAHCSDGEWPKPFLPADG